MVNPSSFPRGWPPILTCYPFPGRFAINLGQGSEKLNLHFNPRIRDSVIICNSRDGGWGQEQRDNHMCFSPGSEVKVRSKGEGARGGRQRESPEGRAPWPRHVLALPEPPRAPLAHSRGLLPPHTLPPPTDLRDLWEGRIRSEAAGRAPADLSQQAGPQPHQLPERAGRAEGLFLQDRRGVKDLTGVKTPGAAALSRASLPGHTGPAAGRAAVPAPGIPPSSPKARNKQKEPAFIQSFCGWCFPYTVMPPASS